MNIVLNSNRASLSRIRDKHKEDIHSKIATCYESLCLGYHPSFKYISPKKIKSKQTNIYKKAPQKSKITTPRS